MKREDLEAQAREAGQAAGHNLQMIVRQPERMVHPNKLVDGITYLNTMIRLSELEMKKDRRPGQSRLRSRLMSLLSSILTAERQKSKGETA